MLNQLPRTLCDDQSFSGTRACQYHGRPFSVSNGSGLSIAYVHASSFSIAARILAMDSSFPMMSMISVAPAGVTL